MFSAINIIKIAINFNGNLENVNGNLGPDNGNLGPVNSNFRALATSAISCFRGKLLFCV